MTDDFLYIGADIGLNGAFTVMDAGYLVLHKERLATKEKKGHPKVKREIDIEGSISQFYEWSPAALGVPICIFIEDPGHILMGSYVSSISLRESFICIRTVATALGYNEIHTINAPKWKKHYNLPGGQKNKKFAVNLAMEYNPELKISTIKEADFAEAALVCRYGMSMIKGIAG